MDAVPPAEAVQVPFVVVVDQHLLLATHVQNQNDQNHQSQKNMPHMNVNRPGKCIQIQEMFDQSRHHDIQVQVMLVEDQLDVDQVNEMTNEVVMIQGGLSQHEDRKELVSLL